MKLGKIKFSQDKLNICQVSLKENIPIIIENYLRFKSFYKDLNIFIICPKREVSSFRKKLRFNEFIIVSEEQIISSYRFKKIFFKLSKKYQFKNLFKERLSWYYQQILKLSFIFYFSKKFKKKIILWDADTIITKKIKFFDGDFSVKFGTFVEFHKSYFEINKELLKKIPKYFISSVIQFGTLTVNECEILTSKLNLKSKKINIIANNLSILILKKIFLINANYNGSLFSEYELIGNSNNLIKPGKQVMIVNIRKGLKGTFSQKQIRLLNLLNFTNVTYEHTYNNSNSKGMLKRKLGWIDFTIIVFKTKIKFYYNLLKHNIFFILNIDKLNLKN